MFKTASVHAVAAPVRSSQVVRAELPAAAATPEAAVGHVSARARRHVLPDVAPIADAPDWAKPNRSWVLKFVGDFQHLRLQLQQACLHGGEPVAGMARCNGVRQQQSLL
jgi:hypothetical protein